MHLTNPILYLQLSNTLLQSVPECRDLSSASSSIKIQGGDIQASRTVCSLMTISVVSALGLDTLAAIAAASVSKMTL